MKSLIVFVLSLISLASCEETFEFGPTNGTVCIRAVFDAEFDLTFTDSNGTHEASFSLPAVKDVEVDGSCAEDNMASLNLTFTTEDTSLVFTIVNKNGQISGDIQFVLLNPSTTFANVTYSSAVSLNGPDQEFSQMGTVNNSYMCHASENALLSSNQTDVKASANITFMNVQFQAFKLPKKNFSNPFECSADHPSTTPMSTTLLTTTLPTPSGVGEYVVKNGTDVCLRMKANITMSVTYDNKVGTMVTRDIMIPENAEVNGTCGDSEITMKFILKPEDEFGYESLDDDFTVEGELNFLFVKDKGFSFIQECDFKLKFNDTNSTVEANQMTNDALALSSKPYMCNSETLKVELDEVVLRNLTVQAFDLSDGNFSKNGLDCHQLPPETPPSQNYTVSNGNTTCISMSVALALKITYETTENKNETKTVNLEKDEPSEGQCSGDGNMEEFITIKYKKEQFLITFQFAKEKQQVSASVGVDAFNYYVESINVTHTLDEDIFTNAKNPGAMHQGNLLKQKLYETSNDKYYKCSTESTFKIDDSVSVVTKDMRLVAFNTDTKQPNLFGDNANECTADTETNSVVPIAVGAALAGLVVIVLIAYLIGRRRNHKGYESV